MIRPIKRLTALLVLVSVLAVSGCSNNPKKKCDTCPKWRSDIQITDESPSSLMV